LPRSEPLSKKDKVKIEGRMALEQAINHIKDVLQSLERGVINVQVGEEYMELTPQPVVDFEMALSNKKDKEKFSFEIAWKRAEGTSVKIS
jgi:amphi-Trp domain-containing protein